MAKSKPKIATLPKAGKVLDFKKGSLKEAGDSRPSGATPTVRKPSLGGRSTGGVPMNKRGGK